MNQNRYLFGMQNNITIKIMEMENNQETLIDRLRMLQEQASVLIQELEANPNFPEGHIITKESWDNADKIIHDGFVYVKYSDLLFYK